MNSYIKSLKWCSNCLMMSTRPRISFDKNGICNACLWAEEKKTINWNERLNELEKLLKKHRKKNYYDCIATVSGGKDSSYVAYNLKHKYNMNPLCLTITPPLPTSLGQKNLKSFIDSGYDHISVNINPNTMRVMDTIGFKEFGFPYYGWLLSIHTSVIRIAQNMGIELIFYGEDGEVEYGGMNKKKYKNTYDVEYQKKAYLGGHYSDIIKLSNLNKRDKFFFTFPSRKELNAKPLTFTHWSYYENWDPYRNYLVAKKKCGLKESEMSNEGTFTNFSQTDQTLYALHTYLMYLKFGFGRASQDACIEIRRGAMDRDQAKNLVILYDNSYPDIFINNYLEYYKISKQTFDKVLDNFANKKLFKKVNNKWQPQFEIN
jgi:N-acetyl sugar amidotransferase